VSVDPTYNTVWHHLQDEFGASTSIGYDPTNVNPYQRTIITNGIDGNNYSVFALNLWQWDAASQSYVRAGGDILYVVPHASTVPEPATILLWSLGGLTMVGVARRRKRKG
jgi:hypothetical protein